jgi:hypothetical protein
MIRESLLPNLHIGTELFLGSIGEPAFNELDGFLQARVGSKKNVNVIGHDHEFVQKISGSAIVVEGIDE